MQRWMQVFSTRKEKKRHLHDLSNSGSVNEGLPCKHLLDPWHHQSMGRRPDESEAATCASHGSYGPPMRPNHLNTTWAPRTALRTHLTATWRKHKTRGPTQGSADPTGRPTPQVGRTASGLAHHGLSRVHSWLSPWHIPRMLEVSHEVGQPL
jgi:hypothetical protein